MDQAQIHIDAPANAVYDLVADITNMGRWSPETHRTQWLDGATAAAPGVRFKGWNRTRIGPLPASWSTTCIIRQADPGRTLSFDTPMSGARWTYRFEPDADGTQCTVTETREEIANPFLVRALWLTIGGLRRKQLADGMQVTLERLKVAAES